MFLGTIGHRVEIRQEPLVDELLWGRRYRAPAVQHDTDKQNFPEAAEMRKRRSLLNIFHRKPFLHKISISQNTIWLVASVTNSAINKEDDRAL